MEKVGKYYVGLDIGTNSVGWAVTDDQYKLCKCKGHKMWGVRLFSEANTAAERRVHRSNRRRLARRNARIQLLQRLFSDEIGKVDTCFFQRLEESKFYPEDKTTEEKYTLFVGNQYNDKDFYKEFPTIYHLRAALMKADQKYDIRLIYLAIHHILKNRGHFLYPGDSFEASTSIDESIKEIFDNTDIECGEIVVTKDLLAEVKDILLNDRITKMDKKRKFKLLFKQAKQLESVFNLAAGMKESLETLYANEEYKDLESEIAKISFSEKVYEEVREGYEEVLQDKILLLDTAKEIYDAVILSGIVKEGKSLSESKVEDYTKHNLELKQLKVLIKKYCKDQYDEIFKEKGEKIANYVNYTGNGEDKCNREDFYKYLEKHLKNVPECEEKTYILEEIALEKYLPLQRVKENGVIPYQVHLAELKQILERAAEYYSFLCQTENNISVMEKIMKIMTFRIPYYVGPLNTSHPRDEKGFAWAVKRSNEKITPWNFEEIVDLEASHDLFIKNLINNCTYLMGEKVLPKQSLLYSEFMLLNELNNIKCDGKKLPVEVRNHLLDHFFKLHAQKGRVTENKIAEFLKREGYCVEKGIITGIDGEIKSDLKSYRDFVGILGDKFNYGMVENMINWITLYADEVKSIKKRILEEYGHCLSEDDIRKICKLKYKDWGRFSKAFLTEVISDQFTDYHTGESGSIIQAMRSTDMNLMELLSDQYEYIRKVNEMNASKFSAEEKIEYGMLNGLYVSPPVKRMIWQSILIMEEIKKVMGGEPEKIFIETTRSNQAEKKRTDSRKKRLLDLYAGCKEQDRDWKDMILHESDAHLRIKKVYLYYLQMGKCMYSGEQIDFEKLLTGEDCDIDHIFPRSKTKDDSFDNLVLVKQKYNRDKSDSYPVSADIQKKMKSFWDFLYMKKFISPRKYERLTRTNGFEAQELADFVNRQLVETSQSTKAVAQIMNRIYKESRVVYAKAENVSDFRHANDILKIRDINDFHHAHDAYLNIVVGNVYDTKFTASAVNFIKDAKFREYSLVKMFDFPVQRNGYVAWDGRNKKSMDMVQSQLKSCDIRVTRKADEQRGGLYNQTVYGKDTAKSGSYIGMKTKDSRLADVTKYGGFTSATIAYYIPYVCEIVNKKGEIKRIRRLIGIPVYLTGEHFTQEKRKQFVLSQISLKKGEVVQNLDTFDIKLKIGSLVQYNGFQYYVGGKTLERFCADSAVQLCLSEESQKYIKKLTNYRIRKKENKDLTVFDVSKEINHSNNLKLYGALVTKMKAAVYLRATQNKAEAFMDSEIKERFEALSVEEQIDVLFEMINLLTNKKSTYDLSPLKMSSSRRVITFNLSGVDEFVLINQSVTGLFENRTNLLV